MSTTTTKSTTTNGNGEEQPLLPVPPTKFTPTNSNKSSLSDTPESIYHDVHDTILLAIPIFFSMLSWVGMKTTDSALLGHVSSQALAAAALSDLWTMCTVVFMSGGVLSILCSSAVGANNPKLAGIYLQVSYYVLSYIMVFVFICWYFGTELFWNIIGTTASSNRRGNDDSAVLIHMAAIYAKILAFSLPGQLMVGQLTQYFSSQRIMHPEVIASAFALICNLVFGMIFVLGIPIPHWNGYGFIACPIVTTTAVYAQFGVIFFIYIVIEQLHKPCWGGWSWKEITNARIRTYCELYIPSAFSLASDFWRVAVIGVIAAKLGTLEVAVFNTGYRIMWIVLIMVNAISSASGIKVSNRLGQMDSHGAKQAGYVGIGMTCIILSCISFFIVWKIRWFGRVFTNDEEFLRLFEEVKIPFVITLLLMNMAVSIERIPYSMGRTREIFWFGLAASWGAQVPGVYFLTKDWRNDLHGLYWGMAIGYGALVVLYSFIVWNSDWNYYARVARERSEMPHPEVAT